MTIKKLINLSASLLLAVAFTSCLGDDDNNINTGTSTGQLFAGVEGYTSNSVSFEIYLPNGTYPYTLVSELSSKINESEYPAGSRAFIVYSMQNGQDASHPLKIDLMNIKPVANVPLDNGTTDDCKMEYPYVITSEQTIYFGGNYINFIASVQESTSRTWEAVLNTETSTEDVAEIYIITEASDPKPERKTIYASINAASLMHKYERVHLHFKTQYESDHVFTLQVPSQSNN